MRFLAILESWIASATKLRYSQILCEWLCRVCFDRNRSKMLLIQLTVVTVLSFSQIDFSASFSIYCTIRTIYVRPLRLPADYNFTGSALFLFHRNSPLFSSFHSHSLGMSDEYYIYVDANFVCTHQPGF